MRDKARVQEPRKKTREEEDAEKRESSLKEKVGQLESLTHEMRKNFYKELMNVRKKGPRKSQGFSNPFEEADELNDVLDVRFFEETKGLDHEIIDILN